ncbi:hypothetical protein ASB56_01225 [Mycoplasmopsis meleagridis]|nr:hypothetical protein ASB56_01225 [Mycoplasmopsis meleagridis]
MLVILFYTRVNKKQKIRIINTIFAFVGKFKLFKRENYFFHFRRKYSFFFFFFAHPIIKYTLLIYLI